MPLLLSVLARQTKRARLLSLGTPIANRPDPVRVAEEMAMIDVLSPCVTFNDHEGSTKSYAYAKDHDEVMGEVSFVPYFEDISVEYDAGTTKAVSMHDGSKLYLKKVAEEYDPTDKMTALRLLHETARRGEFATGVLYIGPDKEDFISLLGLVDEPLASLPLERVRPSKAVLDEVMESLR